MSEHGIVGNAQVQAGPSGIVTTTGVGLVDLLVVNVIVNRPGSVLLNFVASVEIEDIGAPASLPIGCNFGFTWDGVPLPDTAFAEIDAGGAGDIDSFTNAIQVRSLVQVPLPGTYRLAVQFEGISADSKVDVFQGGANLIIEGK